MNIQQAIKIFIGFLVGIFFGLTLITLFILPSGPTVPIENFIIVFDTALIFALCVYGFLVRAAAHKYKIKLIAATEVNHTKDEFISMVLHHLRTPLTGVKWTLKETLKEQHISDAQKKTLAMLYEENSRALEAVEHLIEASRASIGRIEYNFQVFPVSMLQHVITDTTRSLAALANQKNITISVTSPHGSDTQIKIDKEKIQTTIQVILENAILYTSPGGRITISMEEKQSQVLISVADNGMGILEKDKPRIFLQFFRGENVRRKEPQGFGIGLYLAKIFIERHNGAISFESQESKGTKFTVTLPLISLPTEKFFEEIK